MAGSARVVIRTPQPVRSLVWAGDELVDWVSGGQRYALDGSHTPRARFFAFRFDAAVGSSDGTMAVVYERGGTKGLVLQHGEHVREIDRSYYCANSYAYPVCFWSRGGRHLLVHCPDEYNRLEIEDALTGERLTPRAEGVEPEDFFHSRLEVSPGGARLLSAGWVWHPWDAVALYELEEALRDPARLDVPAYPDAPHVGAIEEASATWQTDARVILTASGDEADDDSDDDPEGDGELRLRPRGVAVYDVPERRCVSACQLDRPAGRVMAVGTEHVLALYEHPRLLRLSDGVELESWPDLPSGTELSSIFRQDPAPPPMALDAAHRRVAIARGDEIHVLLLPPDLR